MNNTFVPSTANTAPQAIRDALADQWSELTPELRKAATYVLDNPNDVGVSSIREIAEAADVKPNTFMRMARSVGFEGYDQFRELFREEIRQGRAQYPDRARWLQSLSKGDKLSALYTDVVGSAISNIENTFARIDVEELKAASQMIWKSRRVYTLGVGVNHSIAANFTYLASTGMVDFHAIPNAGSVATDDLAWADQRDVLIAITCSPYRREVVEAVRIAREQGVKVIGVSDSAGSPIIVGSDYGFVVSVDTPQFFPSSVGTIALMEALLSFVVASSNTRVVKRVELFMSDAINSDSIPTHRTKAVTDSDSTPEPIRSLEARYYTDPEIFRLEQAGLLARTWQFAGHSSLVNKPGDYFTFTIAGENLFCVRNREGELHGFYNVCQHRAHELLSGEGNAREVVCPYHAWTYTLNGQLRTGPNINSVPGFDRKQICLTPIRIEVFHGFVFANLDANAAPMDEWFPGVRQQLKAFVPDIDRLQPLEWIDTPEACNWKVSIENYSECYHCTLNHRAFATGVIKPNTYDIQPQGYCLRHTTNSANLERMSYPIDLDSNEHAGEYSSWFLWPMFSFQVYPGNILNTYHWRAVDANHVIIWRGWYTIDGTDSEVVRRLASQDRATTVEEDIHLVESVQRGLNSRGYKPGPLVLDPACGLRSEHSVHALQQWMRDAIKPENQP